MRGDHVIILEVNIIVKIKQTLQVKWDIMDAQVLFLCDVFCQKKMELAENIRKQMEKNIENSKEQIKKASN